MNPEQVKISTMKTARACIAMLFVFILFLSIQEVKQISQPLSTPSATNTITVSGTGDAVAKPDIATFSFGVTENAKTVDAAQMAADNRANAAIKAMKDAGVAENDIQTTSYNINPHYDYIQTSRPSQSVITGYDVSETVQVKVRDLTKAGSLLQTVGSLGVQNINSLQFSIDKPDSVQDAARAKAIDDAKSKADTLAKQLGVSLVRVVSFSENGNYPSPIMYSAKSMALGATSAAAPAPDIATGEQKVTENVSVSYEIK